MRKINTHTTGPIADIAFLLLVFFLVTTQFPKEEGITTTMPPIHAARSPNPSQTIEIWLNGQDEIMVDGMRTTLDECSNNIFNTLASAPRDYRVSLKSHVGASYSAYVEVYDAVKKAYKLVHDQESLALYGKRFNSLTVENQKFIRTEIPIRIMESDLINQ
ncbi:MAG: biopolymer transporter ExbD [Bacteroidia bacterium]|nr:biopolymer transporter ExbD [Bacteroidia bacterium]